MQSLVILHCVCTTKPSLVVVCSCFFHVSSAVTISLNQYTPKSEFCQVLTENTVPCGSEATDEANSRCGSEGKVKVSSETHVKVRVLQGVTERESELCSGGEGDT